VASRPELSVLLDAVLAAGLADALSGDTELTVFAPDNDAFLDLLDVLELESLDELIAEFGLPFVTEVLSFHVVPGIFTAADLINSINANGGEFIELPTLTGGTVTVGLDDGDVILQNLVKVIEPNVEASNGIIHVIDGVLDFSFDTNKDSVIGVSEVVTGQLSTVDQYFFTDDSVRDYYDFFFLEGTEVGQTITVTLESTEFSPLLIVRSFLDFEEIAEDAITFTVDDELEGFFIQVFSVTDGGLGAYTLTTVLADAPPPPTIAEIAVGEEDLTSLVDNLNTDQGDLLLDVTQDLTVFAPVNSAFEAAAGLLATLSAEEIAEVINYHVVASSFTAAELTVLAGQMIPGTDIMVSVVDGSVFVQGAANDAPIQVIAADITASNGVIHKINGILLPEDEPTIAEIAAEDAELSSLVANLTAGQLALLADEDEELTVLAPINSAFAAAGDLLATLSPSQIEVIINYHVLADEFDADDVIALDGQTLPDTDIAVSVVDGTVFLQGAGNDTPIEVIEVDIDAENGIVHKLNGILLPGVTQTIAELATNDADLSELVDNLTADQVALLSDISAELTVLAPIDSAFAAAAGLLATLTAEEVEAVINYHVLVGEFLAADVIGLDGQTLPGTDIAVSVVGGSVFLQGSANMAPIEVIATNILASNGVIHKLDGILLPADTVADVAADDTELTALVEALNEGQLELLSDRTADLTVLAPVNSAFDEAAGLLATLTADEVEEIINYHVLAVRYLAADVTNLDGETIPNTDIVVSVVGGSVFLQGAGNDTPVEIIETDILASNGVIHKLNGILLPDDDNGDDDDSDNNGDDDDDDNGDSDD
jgi:transforming growth factor-beta-induced protein